MDRVIKRRSTQEHELTRRSNLSVETITLLPATLTEKLKHMVDVSQQALVLAYRRPQRALLILRMAYWLVIFIGSLKLLSLPRALQLISAPVRRSSKAVDENEIAGAVDTLLAANVFVFRQSCWKRAALLHRYLALEGIESRINFGMRKDTDGEMTGHAWLERSGQAILEASPPDYTVTFSFPSN